MNEADNKRNCHIAISGLKLSNQTANLDFCKFISCFVISQVHGIPLELAAKNAVLQPLAYSISRLLHKSQLKVVCLVLALNFIARMRQKAIGTEFEVFTIGYIIGMKNVYDNQFTMNLWSKLSGINANRLRALEIAFLDEIGFNCYIDGDEYFEWMSFIDDEVEDFLRVYSKIKNANEEKAVRVTKPVSSYANAITTTATGNSSSFAPKKRLLEMARYLFQSNSGSANSGGAMAERGKNSVVRYPTPPSDTAVVLDRSRV